MDKKNTNKKYGNTFDRIFRENAQQIFIPLISRLLNLHIESYQALPVKFPSTTEREVDFLYEITTQDKGKQILHIEFQSNNDPTMLERMQEYHSKIYRKFKLPVKSLVINVGKKPFAAPNKLKEENIFTGYEIINLFQLSTKDLLSAQIPEVVILALLSNYKTSEIESVLQAILKKLKKIVTNENDFKRYINQLLLLARLRNFGELTTKIINSMPITYNIEKDGLYQKGVQQGIEQGLEQGLEKGQIQGIIICYNYGMKPITIAEKFKISIKKVQQIIEGHLKNKL